MRLGIVYKQPATPLPLLYLLHADGASVQNVRGSLPPTMIVCPCFTTRSPLPPLILRLAHPLPPSP